VKEFTPKDLWDVENAIPKILKEAAKWFCEFSLMEKTPDHTVFLGVREKTGTSTLSKIFADLRGQLQRSGYMNEVFTFIDATHLISSLFQNRQKSSLPWIGKKCIHYLHASPVFQHKKMCCFGGVHGIGLARSTKNDKK
jgi:hypothetical protein